MTKEDYYRYLAIIIFSALIISMWCGLGKCTQPADGPGGSCYTHEDYTQEKYGSGATAYYVFIPNNPGITNPVPMVVFLHGLYGTMPSVYIKWIEHITKKGNIVVFPVYQTPTSMISSRIFLKNIIKSVKDVIDKYSQVIDTTRLAIVGHSAGGLLTANLIATAERNDLPMFKAAMCVAPGKTPMFGFEDLSDIPPETYLLIIAGDSDFMVGIKDAMTIFKKTSQVVNRNYILTQTDLPNLAYHFAALAMIGMLDNIDYYCYWKLFDALCDAAFYDDLNREYCLDDTLQQRFMGEKSNGEPYKELIITLP